MLFGRNAVAAICRSGSVRNRFAASLAGVALAVSPLTSAFAAETKSWAVSWFTAATYSQDGDCPGGLNPDSEHVWRNAMKALNLPDAEIDAFFDGTKPADKQRITNEYLTMRGRIDGKPVNVYANPTALPYLKEEPSLKTTQSKYGFGFNLDGKGAASPNGFEDPETHEQGVDNQFYRAMSCIITYQAKPPGRPASSAGVYGGAYLWAQVRDSMPAWLISVTGEDLSKDGDVTVTFRRALDHMQVDAKGDPLGDDTFRVDPDTRSYDSYHGKIKGGVITIEPGDFHLMMDTYMIPEFKLRNMHLRLNMKADGALDGIMGGYEPWLEVYWATANAGAGSEVANSVDTPTLYYMYRKLADAYPDPKTGRNTHISVSYRVEAVPAFIAPADGVKSKTAQAASR